MNITRKELMQSFDYITKAVLIQVELGEVLYKAELTKRRNYKDEDSSPKK